MAEFETQVEVGADPDSAFEYLADFANMAEWDPSVRAAKALGHGPPAVGSSYVVTTGFYGKAIDLVGETTALEPPHRIQLSLDGGRATGDLSIVVRPSDTGSTVTYRVRLSLRGAARLFDRGLQLALAGMGQNAADGIRKRLGSG